jgi:hypothetical protein
MVSSIANSKGARGLSEAQHEPQLIIEWRWPAVEAQLQTTDPLHA